MTDIQDINIGGCRYRLCLPEGGEAGARYPVVYLCGGHSIEEIAAAAGGPRFLLGIEPLDWGDDLTPWPAPALKRGDKPFGGGAANYLETIVQSIVPYMDAHYPTRPGRAALLGYSLGGLAALYELYNFCTFSRIGCLSGSLWYDGWLEYMESHRPANTEARVYLSLGRGEKHSRNQRMTQVGYNTRRAAELLAAQLTAPSQLRLTWNPGGHFDDIPQRFAQAMEWLFKE